MLSRNFGTKRARVRRGPAMAPFALLLLLANPVFAAQSRPTPTPLEPVGNAAATSRDQPESVPWRPGEPGTRASAKLLALVETVDDTKTETAYSHRTTVRLKAGQFLFDCSGMVNWMLERVAKQAYASLGRERPVAASYVRVIQAAPSSRARGGWQQIAVIDDVEPGDLFAWRRPKDWPKGGNTGHVGVVLAKPEPIAHVSNAWIVRVADSTRWQHQDDTRHGDETGFGMGTLLFVTDDDGHPIGYGWHGSDSGGYYETDVVFGRVHG